MGKLKTVRGMYNYQTLPTQINESANIARWNPSVAIEWMEEIIPRVVNPIIVKQWNKSAKSINKTIDSIESTRYYVKEEYWRNNVSRRLTLLEEEMTLEDYVAICQMQGNF